jgi:RHS repeat-associated protein
MFVDKAGTTAAILDDNDFYPWGGIVPGVGSTTSNNTLKFGGKYRDVESGLDYSGARYYSPTLGRWTRPDQPLAAQSESDPQTWNLYSYALNSPIAKVDANGLRADLSVVAQAQGQISNLQAGDSCNYTFVFLGINSGEPGYMATGTASSISNWSGEFGLPTLDTSSTGNTIVLPNDNGLIGGFFALPNQDQIDTFNTIFPMLPNECSVNAISHSNAVVDLGQVSDEAGVYFANTVIIAPATRSTDTINNIAGASTNWEIVTAFGNSDPALAKTYNHRSAEDWAALYPGHVQGLEPSCHGGQCYSEVLHALVVHPIANPLAAAVTGMNAYSNSLLGIWLTNDLGCTDCQAANPAFQDPFDY